MRLNDPTYSRRVDHAATQLSAFASVQSRNGIACLIGNQADASPVAARQTPTCSAYRILFMPSRVLGNLPTSCLAVFEVAKPSPDIRAVLPTLDAAVQFSRPDVEPSGFDWFLLLVPGLPPKTQFAIASTALAAIVQAGKDGRLPELRIVHGSHLLVVDGRLLDESRAAIQLPIGHGQAGSDEGSPEEG